MFVFTHSKQLEYTVIYTVQYSTVQRVTGFLYSTSSSVYPCLTRLYWGVEAWPDLRLLRLCRDPLFPRLVTPINTYTSVGVRYRYRHRYRGASRWKGEEVLRVQVLDGVRELTD